MGIEISDSEGLYERPRTPLSRSPLKQRHRRHFIGVWPALLIEINSAYIQTVLDQLQQQQYIQLLNAEGVMFFRPHGQSRVSMPPPEAPRFDPARKLQHPIATQEEPVIGILDGMPLTNHTALQGRLLVEDPDDHAALYDVGNGFHGTAMASLVLHGDFNREGPRLRRSPKLTCLCSPRLTQGVWR